MLDNLIRRQYGFLSSPCLSLTDRLLSKLTCHQHDEYPGIFSVTSSAPSSDLLYVCKFASVSGCEHVLAIANEDGKIALQNTNKVGKGRPIQGFQAHENAVFDLAWDPASWKIITGSGDQSSVLLDIGASSIQPVAVFRGHSASIKAVDFSPTDSSTFASGSRDGSIMLWDVRRSHGDVHSKPENMIKCAHPVNGSSTEVRCSRNKKKATPLGTTVNSVTAVLFQEAHTIISAGAADGNIHVWDLRKNYTAYRGDPLPKNRIPHSGLGCRNGITSLCLDPGRNFLYAASMDNVIYEYNVSSYDENPVAVYGGHDQNSFYIKSCLSGDGRYLLSGSSDDFAYIWKVGAGPNPILKLEGHGAEVTCVAWSPSDLTKVVTCSDDVRHRIWRLNPIDEVDSEGRMRLRGQAHFLETSETAPAACEEILFRLRKKALQNTATSCKTPKSTMKGRVQIPNKTPDALTSCSPTASTNTPRILLSSLKTNQELTPIPSGASATRDRAGASRRLELDQLDYSSPTRNLPNYVVDGTSPNSRIRSGTKRKKLDWLTDLGRKVSHNSQNKLRKIK